MDLNRYPQYQPDSSDYVTVKKIDLWSWYASTFSTGYVFGISASKYLKEIEQNNIRHDNDDAIPMDEIKNKIATYFHDNAEKEIGYDDLVETFGLSLSTIVDICEELEREGEIVAVD